MTAGDRDLDTDSRNGERQRQVVGGQADPRYARSRCRFYFVAGHDGPALPARDAGGNAKGRQRGGDGIRGGLAGGDARGGRGGGHGVTAHGLPASRTTAS